MRAAVCIGRVGGLAVALGIGLAVGSGGAAWASPEDPSVAADGPEATASDSAGSATRSRDNRGARSDSAQDSAPAARTAPGSAGRPAPRTSASVKKNDAPAPGSAATPLPTLAPNGSAAAVPAPVGVASGATESARRAATSVATGAAVTAVTAGADDAVMTSATVQSAAAKVTPLGGSGPLAPAQAPLAWTVLAAARGQIGRVRDGESSVAPAAAAATGPRVPTGRPVSTGPTGGGGNGQGASGNGTSNGNGNGNGNNGSTSGGSTSGGTTSGGSTSGGTTSGGSTSGGSTSGGTTSGGTTSGGSTSGGTTPATPAAPGVDLTKPYKAGEVLIGWNPGASATGRAQALAMIQANVIEKLGTKAMLKADQGVYRLLVPGGTEAAIRALANNPAVAFVEPNYQVTTGAIAQDTYYANGSLWGMESDDSPTAYGPSGTTNPYGSGAEEAWGLGYTGSRSVVVGVIDEGMQITHPELAANIWVNPGEVAGDGIDNDANGFIDDVNGWDFYYDDKTVYDAGEDAHGTHVAGTIGAAGGNSTGVAGVNWNVTIIPAKFLGPNGGYISDAVSALNYLTDLKALYNLNLVAVNNSWGGGGYSSAMQSAINRAAKADILFVAAAGNSASDNDTTANYPSNYSSLQASPTESAASYESVIAVASITSTGALSSFSSYGATTVDLAAPGSGIISTVPTNSYANYSGTSMATPHVTGAIALYASYNTTANASALRNAILGNATATAGLTGKTVTGGRLSLEGLFGGATPPPPPVSTYDPAIVSISAPGNVTPNRNVNVAITLTNYGNTAAQARVSLAATGGTPGAGNTVTVPAGGTVTTTIAWKAPRFRTTYTLTATTSLVNSGQTDANPGNNSKTVSITVG